MTVASPPDVEETPSLLTLGGSMELDVELAHLIVDERDLVIRHEPGHELAMRFGWRTPRVGSSNERSLQTCTYSFMTSVSTRLLGELYTVSAHE